MAIIYKISNKITNKCYFGVTIRSLNERLSEHLKELRNNRKRGIWQEEFNKYGESSFTYEIIKEVAENILVQEESILILEFNSLEPNGYNRKIGTGTCGHTYLTDRLENCRYSEQQLLLAIELAKDKKYYTVHEISSLTGMSITSVEDFFRLKCFTWFKDYYPERYKVLEDINNFVGDRRSYLYKDTYIELVEFLATDPSEKDEDIALIFDVSIDTVRDIRRGKSYTWLKEIVPEAYSKMLSIRSSRLDKIRSNKQIYDSVTSTYYSFTSNSDIARKLGVDPRRIGDLVNGNKQSIYNRFTLVPTKI